jgi:putative toxin-antitoxin system antitoxin component (TIGR02293 family)
MLEYQDVVELLGGRAAVGRGVKTVADLDAAISAGLPRSALDHLLEFAAPPAERAKLRNRVVPRASYQRSRRLSAAHSATTERLARVTAMARWVWEDDGKAREFLWRSHPELGGRRPIEAALTELGAREVEEILQRGIHGLPV